MKILTIERSKWRRGEGGDSTYLLDMDGQMCCLGFDALACGFAEKDIERIGEPSELAHYKAPREYLDSPRFIEDDGDYDQSVVIERAIKHNDAEDIGAAEREALIREDLKALGWDDVVFVD